MIILDQAPTGLDAGSARQVKSVLRDLVASGVTIVISTHILEVAERMADCIGIVANGRLQFGGTLHQLRSNGSQRKQMLEELFLQVVGDDWSRQQSNICIGFSMTAIASFRSFAAHDLRLAWRD